MRNLHKSEKTWLFFDECYGFKIPKYHIITTNAYIFTTKNVSLIVFNRTDVKVYVSEHLSINKCTCYYYVLYLLKIVILPFQRMTLESYFFKKYVGILSDFGFICEILSSSLNSSKKNIG